MAQACAQPSRLPTKPWKKAHHQMHATGELRAVWRCSHIEPAHPSQCHRSGRTEHEQFKRSVPQKHSLTRWVTVDAARTCTADQQRKPSRVLEALPRPPYSPTTRKAGIPRKAEDANLVVQVPIVFVRLCQHAAAVTLGCLPALYAEHEHWIASTQCANPSPARLSRLRGAVRMSRRRDVPGLSARLSRTSRRCTPRVPVTRMSAAFRLTCPADTTSECPVSLNTHRPLKLES
jgi:hypothetical protein